MTPTSSSSDRNSATLVVVDNPSRWPFALHGAEVVSARGYLTQGRFSALRRANVFNLCRSYRYQSTGYYVSLLAAARGHRPRPGINAIQDMKSQTVMRVISDELDDLIQKSLAPIQSDDFLLSIYFGRNVAKRYDRLALKLFNLFEAPLLRARFVKNHRWQLQHIRPVSSNEIPDSHRPEIARFADAYFSGPQGSPRRRAVARYDLAILHDPAEEAPPSDARALKRFARAAERLGMRPHLITKDDYGRLSEFDALFIRQTTSVNHHTYRFAQRAAAEGLVVVDDPESIVRCTNKVYLAELAERHGIPTPATRIVHKDNLERLAGELPYPAVLKQPDSSFSKGVRKVEDADAFRAAATELLEESELVLAQEFVPTDFDWRVGVLDGKPLYVCRYYMAPKHWQIIHHRQGGPTDWGKVDTLTVGEAPRKVVRVALRAARLIGRGLYGVDLKTVGKKCYLIEVNDNPSMEVGYEDRILGDELYTKVMEFFLARLERRAAGEYRA